MKITSIHRINTENLAIKPYKNQKRISYRSIDRFTGLAHGQGHWWPSEQDSLSRNRGPVGLQNFSAHPKFAIITFIYPNKTNNSVLKTY